MDLNQSTGNKMPSQEHINFINKLNDAKIPRQSQLIANRLFMKNFPRETTGAEIENCFQSFGAVHDVKIIAKENTHFAFISFVNENTALDVLRQHAIVPLTFQNRPIILAPAYKKPSVSSVTSPTSYYPASGSTMTPPPTPSRTAVNGIPQQPSTPYQQHQQPMSAPHPVYSPIFFSCTSKYAIYANGWYLYNTSRSNATASSAITTIFLSNILYSKWYSSSRWTINQWTCLCSNSIYVFHGTTTSSRTISINNNIK